MSGEWPPAQDAERSVTPERPAPGPSQPYGSSPYGTPPPSGPAPFGPPYPPGPPPHWQFAPPQPLSGGPTTRRPPRHGWGAALATVVGLVLLGLVAVLVLPSLDVFQTPSGTPSRTAHPAPTGTSTKKPGTAPKPSMPTDPKDILKKNPVYALTVPARCSYRGRPSSPAAFRSQVKLLVGCENAAWKKALSATPVEFTKPKVTFYGTRVASPCGKLGSAFPAAYCGSDRTLYFSTASYRQGRYYRLAVAQFVMHEYAHHIQQLAEILPSTWVMDETAAATSRRIELQAHCMAHYQLTHSGLGYSPADRADLEYQFGYTNDASGHGSATAERYWGRRGLSAKSIGACNTWSVKPGVVR